MLVPDGRPIGAVIEVALDHDLGAGRVAVDEALPWGVAPPHDLSGPVVAQGRPGVRCRLPVVVQAVDDGALGVALEATTSKATAGRSMVLGTQLSR